MPPPLLDTGDRDHQFAMGCNRNGQIRDPVLFRADEFLTVDEQNRAISLVDEEQFGYAASLGHLSDLDRSLGQGIIQREAEG